MRQGPHTYTMSKKKARKQQAQGRKKRARQVALKFLHWLNASLGHCLLSALTTTRSQLLCCACVGQAQVLCVARRCPRSANARQPQKTLKRGSLPPRPNVRRQPKSPGQPSLPPLQRTSML